MKKPRQVYHISRENNSILKLRGFREIPSFVACTLCGERHWDIVRVKEGMFLICQKCDVAYKFGIEFDG